MSSRSLDLSHLSDKQLLKELLLGRSAYQSGVFELYIDEAKRRNFDGASYNPDTTSLVDFLSAMDVSRITTFDEPGSDRRAAFPGVVSRTKRVTGPLVSLIGIFFLLAFFSWLSNPVWPMLLFGTLLTVVGVFRYRAGKAMGYFLDTEGLYELEKNDTKGSAIFNWKEVTEVELVEVPRRKSFLSLFANAFVRFTQDLTLGTSENQVRFCLEDGREILLSANKIQHFELFVITIRRIRNLTKFST